MNMCTHILHEKDPLSSMADTFKPPRHCRVKFFSDWLTRFLDKNWRSSSRQVLLLDKVSTVARNWGHWVETSCTCIVKLANWPTTNWIITHQRSQLVPYCSGPLTTTFRQKSCSWDNHKLMKVSCHFDNQNYLKSFASKYLFMAKQM